MDIPGYTYITHKLITRPWGPECRFTVKCANGSFIDEVMSIPSMSITEEDLTNLISNRLSLIQAAIDYEALKCHYFDDVGPELRLVIKWIVRKIRQYPSATLAQAEAAWDAEWADSFFSFDKLVVFLRSKVGDGVTWDGFKTYVIDHKFSGVD